MDHGSPRRTTGDYSPWSELPRIGEKTEGSSPAEASWALVQIERLYQIERKAKEWASAHKLSEKEFWELRESRRREEAKPILAEFEAWLKLQQKSVLPKSPLASALGYALNQWLAFTRYVDVGQLEIDNNLAEQGLRGMKLGLKNYLFFGDDSGGLTAAILYSLISSSQRHGIEPWYYLRDVLERMPGRSGEGLRDFLPNHWAEGQRFVGVVGIVTIAYGSRVQGRDVE